MATTLLQNVAALIARVLLSQIFLMAGIGHLLDWGGTIKYMTAKGMALEGVLGGSGIVFTHIMLAGAVTFLLLGGLSVLLGFHARWGSVLLIVFLLSVTPIFHNFWAYEAADPRRVPQMLNFLKNTGLAGGLLMVLAFGSGRLSIDTVWPFRRAKTP